MSRVNRRLLWAAVQAGGGGVGLLPTIQWGVDSISGNDTQHMSELPVGSEVSWGGTWTDSDASIGNPVDEIWLTMYGRTVTGVITPVNGDAAFDSTSGIWSFSGSPFELKDDGKTMTIHIRDGDGNEASDDTIFYWNVNDLIQAKQPGHPNARGTGSFNYWDWSGIPALSSGTTSWLAETSGFWYSDTTTGYGGAMPIQTAVATSGPVIFLTATVANGHAGNAVWPHFCMSIPPDVEVNIEVFIDEAGGSVNWVSQGVETFYGPLEFSGQQDELNMILPPYNLADGDTIAIRIWSGGTGFNSLDDKAYPIWQFSDMKVISQAEAARSPAEMISSTLASALTTDNVTSVTISDTPPANTPASGMLLVEDNDTPMKVRRLEYSSFTGSTFTITTTDGDEDFASVNASAGKAVYIPTIDAWGIFVDPVAGLNPTGSDSEKIQDFLNRIGRNDAPFKSHFSYALDSYQLTSSMKSGTYTIYQKNGTVADQHPNEVAIFSGPTGYADLNTIKIGATNNFEVQFDVYLNALPGAGSWGLLSQWTAGTAGRLMVSVNSSGTVNFFIDGATDVSINSTTNLVASRWYTIGIHREGDNFHLTIDRVAEGSQTQSGISVQQRDTFLGSDDGSYNAFNGKMRHACFNVIGGSGSTFVLTNGTSLADVGATLVAVTDTTEATGDAISCKGGGANPKSYHVKAWPYTYGHKPVVFGAGIFPISTPHYGSGEQAGLIQFRNCTNSSVDGFIARHSKGVGIRAARTSTAACNNITIKNCVVDRSASDGIIAEGYQTGGEQASQTFVANPITEVHISGCNIIEANYAMQINPNHVSGDPNVVESKTGQALTFIHATDCSVSRCRATDYFKEGFDSISSRRITFTDLYAKRNPNSVYGTQRGTAFYSDSQGEGSEDITFDRCECGGDTAGVVIASEGGGDIIRVVARNCVVYNTTSSGLIFSDESNTGVVVRDSGFEHCSVSVGNQFAVRSTLGSPNLTADDMFVRHCVLKSNLQAVMASDHGFTNWLIDRNLWYSAGGAVTSEKGTNSLEGDPLFTSSTDLRLGVGSPGLDAIPNGNIIRTLNISREFVTPPDGSGPDNMGAY